MTPVSRAEGALRIEAWTGEVRVNLVRLAALLAFCTHHLYRVWQQYYDRHELSQPARSPRKYGVEPGG